ncbi:MAG: ABC transporter permease subunit, partial [Phycisphaeraceae bacterium]|nr:ABC transporter permease subunit [Phycisphaeraceae bacterium]
MLGQLFTISRNTFKESIRQPIFVVLIFVAGLLLVLNPSLAAYTMEDDDRLLVDLGLSTLFLIGLLLAAFTATNVLTVELENRTVLTVVSKPVPRPVFMLGKFLGVAAAILIAFWTLSTIFLLTVRHGVMTTNA